jgi:hypothetical protein
MIEFHSLHDGRLPSHVKSLVILEIANALLFQRFVDSFLFFFIVQGYSRASFWCIARANASDLSVKLRTLKKRFFPLFLLSRVEISVSFVQNVVEN